MKKNYYRHKNGKRTLCYRCYGQVKIGSYNSRKKVGLSLDGIYGTKIIFEWKLKLITYVVFS